MELFRRHIPKNIFIAIGVLAVALAYLVTAYYNEIRALFSNQPPKVLVDARSNQCELYGNANPHKLMFVSCSGFYDEE